MNHSEFMNPLIPKQKFEIDGVVQDAVNARDLWRFFKPYSPFASWMYNKLLQHRRFAEHTDFVRVSVVRRIKYLGCERLSYQIDYILTVAMAEAIGAVEFCRGPNPWQD